MGSCLQKLDLTYTARPNVGEGIDSEKITEIVRKTLNPSYIQVPDRTYVCTTASDIKPFLNFNLVNTMTYRTEVFDCDDFAHCLYSDVRKWIASTDIKSPLAFGYVHGDIRKSEDDTTSFPHAVNFFIDQEGKVWLIEPQSDKIFAPTSNSIFWFAYL